MTKYKNKLFSNKIKFQQKKNVNLQKAFDGH